jgi:hypothetical protein
MPAAMINILAVLVALLLSYVCGLAFGAHDATKPALKHDGRRSLYRGALIVAICGLAWLIVGWRWWHAATSVIGCVFMMSMGVRFGFNKRRPLHRFYMGSTVLYDLFFIQAVTGEDMYTLRDKHEEWYKDPANTYRDDVHRAGEIATTIEAGIAISNVLVVAVLEFCKTTMP